MDGTGLVGWWMGEAYSPTIFDQITEIVRRKATIKKSRTSSMKKK
jgi:hypothetical protein